MHIPSVTRRRQVIPLEIWRERFGLMIHLETAQIRAVTFRYLTCEQAGAGGEKCRAPRLNVTDPFPEAKKLRRFL